MPPGRAEVAHINTLIKARAKGKKAPGGVLSGVSLATGRRPVLSPEGAMSPMGQIGWLADYTIMSLKWLVSMGSTKHNDFKWRYT